MKYILLKLYKNLLKFHKNFSAKNYINYSFKISLNTDIQTRKIIWK